VFIYYQGSIHRSPIGEIAKLSSKALFPVESEESLTDLYLTDL